jgi:hypothetical protein
VSPKASLASGFVAVLKTGEREQRAGVSLVRAGSRSIGETQREPELA